MISFVPLALLALSSRISHETFRTKGNFRHKLSESRSVHLDHLNHRLRPGILDVVITILLSP
jgi:hypothetical protein